METLKLLDNTGNTKIYLKDSYNFGTQVYVYDTILGMLSVKQHKLRRNGWYIEYGIGNYGDHKHYHSSKEAFDKIVRICDTEFERLQAYLKQENNMKASDAKLP